jgi:hypothetical protein
VALGIGANFSSRLQYTHSKRHSTPRLPPRRHYSHSQHSTPTATTPTHSTTAHLIDALRALLGYGIDQPQVVTHAPPDTADTGLPRLSRALDSTFTRLYRPGVGVRAVMVVVVVVSS